jgi:hypothetical protein
MGEKIQACKLPNNSQREKLDQKQIPADLTFAQIAEGICRFLTEHGVEAENGRFLIKVPNETNETKVEICGGGTINFKGAVNEDVMRNLAVYATSCIEASIINNVLARIGREWSRPSGQTLIPAEVMLPVARSR